MGRERTEREEINEIEWWAEVLDDFERVWPVFERHGMSKADALGFYMAYAPPEPEGEEPSGF